MNWKFWKKPIEARSSGSGYTAEIMAARESYISGSRGIAELTSTVQSCVGLWESGLSCADVIGTDLLTRRVLALCARALALRGECVFVIEDDKLVPASDWDLTTRHGDPRAYRLSISEAGGGTTRTALAAEVVHLRIGADVVAPWTGTASLRRASITAGMLHAVEDALRDVFGTAALGSMIVPFPESPDTDMEKIGRGFREQRGRVLLRESVTTTAAGGPVPQTDWRPADVSPDLSKSMTKETLAASRDGIASVFGVLPGLMNPATTGPMVREAQRHLAQWQLSPIAGMIGEELTEKLGSTVTLDVMRPLQAFDAGGRARAVTAVVKAMAEAKDAGVDVAPAMKLVDWDRLDAP